jgi:hypothetical protein
MPPKKLFAVATATLSGLYLLVMGPTLDPMPVLDECAAGLIFLNSLAALGFDLRKVIGRRNLDLVPVRVRGRGR